ncbi:replication-associated recombination protein A [Myxococcota bacterium]|nr:replication-associated recombination protein A [Myxococcota bacterium]MBU1432384.1 replication-associated recombination protein A [Myxococcota bacterium]MBU1897832.1 replication-associated recombination protein A [Myxococcota bacterium]
MELFEHSRREAPSLKPLAEALRPNTLDELFGQPQAIGRDAALRRAIERDQLPSVILWGPPGSGKTTLAHIIAKRTRRAFEPLSAVLGGVKEVRQIVAAAVERAALHQRKTILFIDEIHRFNKSQQDALLPHVEDGTLTLIGATTDNPASAINPALLSRAQVVVLQRLDPQALGRVLQRAMRHPLIGHRWPEARLSDEGAAALIQAAEGDARRLLGALESALNLESVVTPEVVAQAINQRAVLYDKGGDGRYHTISAFIKSMRGGDPDAAAYWLQRMIDGGEDPLYVLRRMVIFASEDVGLADPQALPLVTAALHAVQLVGMPEGMFNLIHAAVYLACAPKSNTVLQTLAGAMRWTRERGALPIPDHLKPSQPLSGGGYRQDHNYEGDYAPQSHLPEALRGQRIFEPNGAGVEATIRARLMAWRAQAALPKAPAAERDGFTFRR